MKGYLASAWPTTPFLPSPPPLRLRPHPFKTVWPSASIYFRTMEGLISIPGCVEALILLIFFLGQPVVPETPQLPPGCGVDSSSSSSSSSPLEACDNSATGANASFFASFFYGARDFVIKNLTIIIQGDNANTVAQGEISISWNSFS